MKKKFVFILSVCLIACLIFTVGVSMQALALTTTTSIKVDPFVYRGEYNGAENAIVWVDLTERDPELEYGTYLYKAGAEEVGEYFPTEVEGTEFATAFELARLDANVEYGVKGYSKSGEGEEAVYKYSRTQAFIINNDGVTAPFDVKMRGNEMRWDSQEPVSDHAGDQYNVQYFAYLDGAFLGCTDEFSYDVIGDMIVNGDYEEKEYEVTIKTMSGLGGSADSNEFSFTIEDLDNEAEFLGISSQTTSNKYYVLTKDMDLTEATWQKIAYTDFSFWNEASFTTLETNGNFAKTIIPYLSDAVDANGHKITVKYEDTSDKDMLGGLFGWMSETGSLSNAIYVADVTYNGQDTNGRRYAGLSAISNGRIYDTAIDYTVKNTGTWERDVLIGYPAFNNLEVDNVVCNFKTRDASGNVYDANNGKTGIQFLWEGLYSNWPLTNYIGITDNSKTNIDIGGGIYMLQGSIATCSIKNATVYNSVADVLSGTNGVNYDTVGLGYMSQGEYRTGVVYNKDWDTTKWTFDATNGVIKLYGTTVFTAEVAA